MRKGLLLAAAMLSLAACADRDPVADRPRIEPPRASTIVGPPESIFTTQTPESFIDATPGSEVATRWTPSENGHITGFRFYQAPGEPAGGHVARLWTITGSQIASATFTNDTSPGWHTVNIFGVQVGADQQYLVSVNTKVKQAKTYAYFANHGPISHGHLTADFSYYGPTMGAFPTSGSASIYFVDVIYRVDCELFGSCP